MYISTIFFGLDDMLCLFLARCLLHPIQLLNCNSHHRHSNTLRICVATFSSTDTSAPSSSLFLLKQPARLCDLNILDCERSHCDFVIVGYQVSVLDAGRSGGRVADDDGRMDTCRDS
jgi:hypothetical protein